MNNKPTHRRLFIFAALCTNLFLNTKPLNVQTQTPEEERKNGSFFYLCSKKIQEKEKDGCISQKEALKLTSELSDLQHADLNYVIARYRASGDHDDYYRHNPALLSQAKTIMNHLNMQTTVNEPWKNEAKLRSWGVTGPGQKPWPPRDENGQMISGPITGGTREQIGYPMYGWTKADHLKYNSGSKVKVTSTSQGMIHGIIEN